MHTPGHNPFMTEGGGNYNAIIEYLTGFDLGYENEEWNALTNTTNVPLYGGGYQYQGMSSDIMSALGNVFTPSGNENFNIQDFVEGDVNEQIENYLANEGVLFQGNVPNLDSDQYWAMGDEEWTNQLFATPSDVNINPNLDESVLAYTNIFDPESLANTLTQLGDKDLTAAEVKALTPEMLEKTTSGYYSPYEEAERASLVDKLGTATAKVNTGGFAGSGSRTAGLSGAERLYRGGYEDILGDIAKLRGGATTDVLDTIYGWQELMSDV